MLSTTASDHHHIIQTKSRENDALLSLQQLSMEDETPSGDSCKTDGNIVEIDPVTGMEDTVEGQMEGHMLHQISQLQDIVREMKEGFGTAMTALASIQYGDQMLAEKVDHNKAQYEQQLADVVHMILTLKTELGSMVGQLQLAGENQRQLEHQVESLQYERDILLEALEKAGAISVELREKYHSGRRRPAGLNKSSDSTTLSILLERAHSAFRSSGHSHSFGASDHDSGVNTYRQEETSCEDTTPPIGSPLMQSYIAGLQDDNNGNILDTNIAVDEQYESDSSLTMAANKSLDLSRSLGDQCADVANLESSDEEMETEEEAQNKIDDVEVTPVLRQDQPLDHSSPFKKPASVAKLPPHERNAAEVHRLRVSREILDTERRYCNNLWTILQEFVSPLRQSGIVSAKEIDIMFPPCISQIYESHCAFLQKLENRLVNWRWQCVLGDVFAQFIDSSECELLSQYKTYVADFPIGLQLIRKTCKHSSRFRKFLRARQRHPNCEGLDISAFLLTPIQRIPRYVLLLKQLLKFTNREYPDYYYIENSLEKVGGFLSELNDSIESTMQLVAEDDLPKSRRRLRVPSLRSSGSSHHSLSVTKDNTFSSQHSTDLPPRALHLSLMKEDSAKNLNEQLQSMRPPLPPLPPLPPGQLSSTLPRFSAPTFTCSPPAASKEKTSTISRLLPSRISEKRRKMRSRRPQSGDASYNRQNQKAAVPRIQCNGAEVVDCAASERRRPLSMVEFMSDSSAPSNVSSATTSQLDTATSRETIYTTSDVTSVRSIPLSPGSVSYPRQDYVSTGFLSTTLNASQNHPDSSKSLQLSGIDSRYHTMPPTIQNYGIYGDSDITDDSTYEHSPTLGEGVHRFSGADRSVSHGNVMQNSTDPFGPTQHQINMALARSLTDDSLRSAGSDMFCVVPSTTPHLVRPKSAPLAVHQRVHGSFLQDSFQNNTIDRTFTRPQDYPWGNITMTDSMTSQVEDSQVNLSAKEKKKEMKKRKKEWPKRRVENMGENDSIKRDKKTSFKQSLKNIFFKRRKHEKSQDTSGAKLQEVESCEELRTERLEPQGSPTSVSSSSFRQQAPPKDDLVVVSPVSVQSEKHHEICLTPTDDSCSAV